MVDVIQHLKSQARILHRNAREGDPSALKRVFGSIATLGVKGEDELSAAVNRSQCLSAVAKGLGFKGWAHLTNVFAGRDKDFGTLLCPDRMSPFWNIWCKTHEEASKIRQETSGYLLAYKTQFLVVDADYVAALGLNPDDQDWALIGYDWAKPRNREARNRLYGKLITATAADKPYGGRS